MKRGFDDKDFISGNEYFHVTSKGEVLTGQITRDRGENYISTEHTCPCGKDTYDTYENAKRALKLRNRKSKDIYKCEICGYWHLTSKDGSKRKKKFDKRTRSKPIKIVDHDIKEEQKLKQIMKQRPSYYRVIKGPEKEKQTRKKVTLSDLFDFKSEILK